ncbi:MAG: STAS domain-containing protein [Caldilineaceae bacterium]|nr:STAS domain-containing protein [Caldilineaceae bacterium]
MKVTIHHAEGDESAEVIEVEGELDASTYEALIEAAKTICASGPRNILIDLSNVNFMASSGLVALHSVALLARGAEPPDPTAGWNALRAVSSDINHGYEKRVKLLNPQPRVRKTLEMTGFADFLEIFDDREAAMASFGSTD